MARIRERLPGASVPWLESKRKHSHLQHRQWEEGASTAALRCEAGWREAPVGGRQLSVRIQQGLKRKKSPRPVHALLWHISFRKVRLLPFQFTTLQSQRGKPREKVILWS